MRNLSKFIVLLLAGAFLLSAPEPVYAQSGVLKRFSGACRKLLPASQKPRPRKDILSPKNMEKTLARRAHQSRKLAWKRIDKDAQRLLMPSQSTILNNHIWVGENLDDLYADNPILKNASILIKRQYFQAANNRLVPGVLKQRLANLLWLKQNEKLLVQAARPLNPTPKKLAAQIPPDAQYWFIGEEHGQPKVRQTIAEVFRAFRALHPGRQIVFFTEFLPQGANAADAVAYANLGIYKGHAAVWNVVHRAGVPLVGLEPRFVYHNRLLQTRYDAVPGGEASESSIWLSLEGMRLRNQAWVKLMREYRKKYPKAMFVVHCGEAHSDYLEPFSLARSFPADRTFVSAFYTPASGNQFEQVIPIPFTKMPALKWSSRRYGRATGYDLRVLISR